MVDFLVVFRYWCFWLPKACVLVAIGAGAGRSLEWEKSVRSDF